MEEDFNNWNEQKKILESTEPVLYPQEGEVWMGILGRNLGFEENGKNENFSRPFFVLKKFNSQMFWIVPLSSQQKRLDFYYNFTDVYGNGVSALLAQLRLVSLKRFDRFMYKMPALTKAQIKLSLIKYVL